MLDGPLTDLPGPPDLVLLRPQSTCIIPGYGVCGTRVRGRAKTKPGQSTGDLQAMAMGHGTWGVHRGRLSWCAEQSVGQIITKILLHIFAV